METVSAKQILSIPKTRNPFVNNNLLYCGKNKNGKNRYWISSVNNVSGPMGLIVTSDGNYKTIEFNCEKINRPDPDMCYYASAYVGNDTVFLTSSLSEISSINIETGEYHRYPTGLPYASVFAGMNFDEETGKILYSGVLYGKGMCSVSFDINSKVSKSFITKEGFYCYEGFKNGDGTQTQTFFVPSDDLPRFIHVKWNPKDDTLKQYLDVKRPLYRKFIFDKEGRVYYGSLGWLDGKTEKFVKGPFCGDDNICFFYSDFNTAYGTRVFKEQGVTKVYKWEIEKNVFSEIFIVPHAQMNVFEMTEDGNILAINMYAELFLFDTNGNQILYKEIKADSIGLTDTCIRLNESTILGTPFITQRFWLVNTITGEGTDAGRAAPNEGEVLMAWEINGKGYMAGYTTGALTEYNPNLPLNFPNNPRVILEPPTALRLTCGTSDGKNIFYMCSRKNGLHGSVAVKYDSVKDKAEAIVDIFHGQQFYSLMYNKKHNVLIGGTTFYADGFIQKPISENVYLATISIEPFKILQTFEMPKGYKFAGVFGCKDEDTYFVYLVTEDCSYNVSHTAEFSLLYPEKGLTNIREYKNKDVHVYATRTTCELNTYIACQNNVIKKFTFLDGEFIPLKEYKTEGVIINWFYQNNEVFVITRKNIYIFNF